MGRGAKGRAWWSALPPEKRAELKRRHAAQAGASVVTHHGLDDVACTACGTDSTVGCIAVNHG